MTALKSARDQMNKPTQVNLMLVMSGSDRDKLLRLVVSAERALLDASDRQRFQHAAHQVPCSEQRPAANGDMITWDATATRSTSAAATCRNRC